METNETIKERRESLGRSMDEVAAEIGLTWNEYWDVEAHADEIETAVALMHVKSLCRVLGFHFFDLFAIQCPFCHDATLVSTEYSLPRNQLIRQKREEKKLSISELADRLGFYDEAVEKMERDPDFLETWPMEHISNLAREIGVPVQILLGVKCPVCNH
jgi:transcriptional regulator with XRE-family HTH domain